MEFINALHSIFLWVSIVAAFLSAFSILGTWWTGGKIEEAKAAQVELLQEKVQALQPNISSQSPESINIIEDGLYKHSYKVVVDSPNPDMLVFTNLSSAANKIGTLITTPTGVLGVHEKNGTLLSFKEYIYTFKTDKPLNIETDTVLFSAVPEKGTEYIRQ